ncbi:HPF/RaiA family ribosome-associated protein [Streptomyces sp. NPDC014006]|uniref:HPF/RaiA family ribosome-associated protein n=1 Tax=Streptomyces sp. NPDC014006 TaxID=3364870 RepID=UPI0036FF4824
MTTSDTGAPVVLIRSAGAVDDDALAYVREKVEAVLARPGLPPAHAQVRLNRSAAHHVRRPWFAAAEIRLGGELVVAHAQEADAREVTDQLQDRLRSRLERATHRWDTARRSAAAPPWRGGPAF